MSHGFKIKNENNLHFITMTTVGWIDIFAYQKYKQLIVKNLNFCIEKKGLVIYSWVLMSNHLHLICSVNLGIKLSSVLRDFKSYTAKEIIKLIDDNSESRREWILHVMKFNASFNKRNEVYQVWQQDNHPIELESPNWIVTRLNYIHNNPVRQEIVDLPEDYLYSSARDYSGKKGLVKVEILDIAPSIGYLGSM
jgi:putative transposase